MTQKGIRGDNYKPLSEEAIRSIHRTSMKVFEQVGFEVNSESASHLFKLAGAKVDEQNRIVKIPQELVMKLIEKAPSQVKLCGQNREHDLVLEGSKVYMGTGGTALYIIDMENGSRRKATLNDLKQIAKLVNGLQNIHFFLLPTYPSDLPVEKVDVNRFFAGLDNVEKHVMGGVYTIEGIKKVIQMAEIISGSPEKLRQEPIISMITLGISPLKVDKLYGEMLVTIARAGIPVAYPAEPISGATSPATLAGTLVIQNVDSLIGVLLAQIANPGTPVIYGSVATNADPRDLKYLAGSIESGLLSAAGAQLAQFYNLPFYATGGMSDAKVIDAQCGYESALTILLCALAGGNLIHDAAGLLDFALSASYEKYVIDNEIIGMAMRAVKGIKVDEDKLAFDVIKQVGPGGNFLSSKHTRRYVRSEPYYPTLSDRSSWNEWEGEGKKDICRRAKEKVSEILSNQDFHLPPDVRSKILAEIPEIVD